MDSKAIVVCTSFINHDGKNSSPRSSTASPTPAHVTPIVAMNNQAFVDDRISVQNCTAVNHGPLANTVTAPEDGTPVGKMGSEKQQEPLALCSLFVRRYKLTFSVTLALHLAALLLTGILQGAGNVFDLEYEQVPITLLNDQTYLRAIAWDHKKSDIEVLTGTDRPAQEPHVKLIYSTTNGDTVFTAERLKKMRETEEMLMALVCSQAAYSLRKPESILRFFDEVNDTNFANVTGLLYQVSLDPKKNEKLQFFLSKDAEITAHRAHSSRTRSILFTEDSALLKTTLDKINGVADMEFLYFDTKIFAGSLMGQVIRDMMLAIGSFIFIFVLVWVLTGSLFISSLGIFSIVSSFFITYLIYRYVLQYLYFGVFHVISIFIILGLGADDLFVFMDTWKSTAHDAYPSLEHRLSACYRRAARATLYTSLTTMVAFFSNAFSPLLAVQSFGVFSGILIFVNYLSVIIYFPTVLIVYHKHLEDWTWPCFRLCKRNRISHDQDTGQRHAIVRFFHGPFYRLLTDRIIRWVSLSLCLWLVISFAVFAAKLEPDHQNIQYYPDNHHFTKAMRLDKEGFKPSSQDKVVEVYIVWGLKNQDLSICKKSEYKCNGRTVWDDAFDLNSKRAQSAVLDFCAAIRNLSESQENRLKIRRHPVTNEVQVDCFIERLNDYMKQEVNKAQYQPGDDLSLPTSERKVETLVLRNLQFYKTPLPPSFYRYFETAMGYWLHDGYSQSSNRTNMFVNLLGLVIDSRDTQWSYPYLWGTQLRYAAIKVSTTIKPDTLSYIEGIPIVEAWEEFIQNQSASMPAAASGMFQFTPTVDTQDKGAWHNLYVQKELVDSAIKGIAIGICLAFFIITFATENVITGFLATLNICCVTLSVIGLIPMTKRHLGVLESVNLTLVVGLAVDYVVHLAEGYHSSPAPDRLTRTRDMLDHVGISILSGAITSLGAAVFMFAAEILFFVQFGIFMFGTIGFSLFFSLMGFSALMGLLGPQGQTGSVAPFFRWVQFHLRGKRSHHVYCDKCGGKGFHATESNCTTELN